MPVEVITFGCRLNAVESEIIRAGAEAVAGPDEDLVVVNTCAVTAGAEREAIRALRRLGRERPGARLVVTGCAAQVDPAVYAAMPEVSAVVGNAGKLDPGTWARVRAGDAPPAGEAVNEVGDIMAERGLALPRLAVPPGRTRAFVPVQNGCDHRCTFCIIPLGRGRARSVPAPRVVAEVERLVAAGAREVVLTGVDLTSYGCDHGPGAPGLGGLVRAILRGVPALDRLRLSSLDAVEVDAELMAALGEEPRLMPHLHLSLQAGDDLVLKRMARRHRRADAIRLCADLRARRPDIVLGADLIAGFPTEDEAMFARTLDLVEACGLTHLHVFPYSPRPGTPAARMPAVPAAQVRARAARLREAGAVALARHLAAEVGATRRVLVENGGLARTEAFTPVRVPPGLRAGELREVGITGHDGRHLVAAPVSPTREEGRG